MANPRLVEILQIESLFTRTWRPEFTYIELNALMDALLNSIIYYILIVDDEQDDHYFLKKALDQVVPYAIVDSIYDGAEALEYLDKCISLPSLIFLDLNMPKVSGKDTIMAIRNNENLKNVPVIILTTSRSESEKTELLKLGANAFYSKPYDQKDLVKIVREVRDQWL